jgi:hypothetical protein
LLSIRGIDPEAVNTNWAPQWDLSRKPGTLMSRRNPARPAAARSPRVLVVGRLPLGVWSAATTRSREASAGVVV